MWKITQHESEKIFRLELSEPLRNNWTLFFFLYKRNGQKQVTHTTAVFFISFFLFFFSRKSRKEMQNDIFTVFKKLHFTKHWFSIKRYSSQTLAVCSLSTLISGRISRINHQMKIDKHLFVRIAYLYTS